MANRAGGQDYTQAPAGYKAPINPATGRPYTEEEKKQGQDPHIGASGSGDDPGGFLDYVPVVGDIRRATDKAASGDYTGAAGSLLTGAVAPGLNPNLAAASAAGVPVPRSVDVTNPGGVVDDLAKAVGVGPTDTRQLSADEAAARAHRDAITQHLENAQPGVAPTVAPTQLGATAQAAPVTVAPAAQVGQTIIGSGNKQNVQAPILAATGPVTATTVAPGPGFNTTERATATTVGPAARVGAMSTAPTVAVHAPTLARTASVGPAQVGAIREAVAPTVQRTTLDTTAPDEIRARQLQLTDMLEAGAAGTGGPTAAEALLQKQNDRAVRNQMGLAISRAHGGNVGLAMREANSNIGQLQAEAGVDAAALRAKEQQDQQQRLLQALEGTRTQDIGLTTKAADLASAANLTEAQLGTQTSLANLDTRTKTALTQAELEQEAAQKEQERRLTENTTAAAQELAARTTTAGAQNAASLQSNELQSQAAIDLARREDAARALEAGFTQQTSVLNATEENKRRADEAARQLEAAKANQSTALSAATTTAQIGSAESIERAQIEAKVAMDNAQRELSTLQEQARLNQAQGIRNAELEQQIALKQAELDSASLQFNAGEQNKLNVAQGDITSRESITDADAIAKQRQLDWDREHGLTTSQLEADQNVLGADTGQIGIAQKDAAARRDLAEGIIGGVAKVAALSDERRKTDITEILTRDHGGGDELLDAFDAVSPYKFRYKDPSEPGARPGQRYGVMAQDLEKSPVGRSVVVNDGGEKKIDTGAAVGVALAAIADMKKQMDALKARGKGARR
jgi:hypothetical protein